MTVMQDNKDQSFISAVDFIEQISWNEIINFL